MKLAGWRDYIRLILGLGWLVGQLYIIYYPTLPLIQRPLHLLLAMSLVITWSPLKLKGLKDKFCGLIDLTLLAGIAATTFYFMDSANRLTGRMEGVSLVRAVHRHAGGREHAALRR